MNSLNQFICRKLPSTWGKSSIQTLSKLKLSDECMLCRARARCRRTIVTFYFLLKIKHMHNHPDTNTVSDIKCTFCAHKTSSFKKLGKWGGGEAIKIPESSSQSSLVTLCTPSLTIPLLFLSIVSTKHHIQAPMTSPMDGCGRLRTQWRHADKGQFIKAEGWQRGRWRQRGRTE